MSDRGRISTRSVATGRLYARIPPWFRFSSTASTPASGIRPRDRETFRQGVTIFTGRQQILTNVKNVVDANQYLIGKARVEPGGQRRHIQRARRVDVEQRKFSERLRLPGQLDELGDVGFPEMAGMAFLQAAAVALGQHVARRVAPDLGSLADPGPCHVAGQDIVGLEAEP